MNDDTLRYYRKNAFIQNLKTGGLSYFANKVGGENRKYPAGGGDRFQVRNYPIKVGRNRAEIGLSGGTTDKETRFLFFPVLVQSSPHKKTFYLSPPRKKCPPQ